MHRLMIGRVSAKLMELHLSLEYGGWLEGLPTREFNDRSIKALAEQQAAHGIGVFVIEPKQEPIEWVGPVAYPLGEPAKLPPVRCVARFQASKHVDPDAQYSELIILWWQQEFGLPTEEDVLPRLREIEWASHATDVSDW